MKYLLSTTEIYRFSSEEEASKFIEESKKEKEYNLIKSTTAYKEKKQKGEVIDYWWTVTLVKKFNSEQEPESEVTINYERESAF